MNPPMLDDAKIEDAVLALLGVFEFDNGRTWKRYEFAVMDALFEKGYISDPKGRAESVYLTQEGLARSRALAEELFKKEPA